MIDTTAPLVRPGSPDTFSRVVERTAALRTPAALTLIGALLVVCWGLTFVTGGTARAVEHSFYAPIILAALPFRLRGALLTSLLAGVMAGPLMPLDAVTGDQQPASTWVTRAVVFAAVGTVVALTLEARRRSECRRLADELRHTFSAPQATPVDERLVPLVADVLVNRRFHTLYQPIYELRTGDLLAVEALSRFDAGPASSPDLWFAAAHAAGLGTDLELAAIRSAIDGSHELPERVELSVNASPATMADPRLVRMLQSTSRRITLEVTEHVGVDDYEGFATTIALLRSHGARIAVDDAGAGVASLRHIVQIAPNVIKLDISLTQGVSTSPLRLALATSLIEFAEQTGAQLLVEGVEEVADLRTWVHLGAHAVQGFLVGRPSPLPVPVTSLHITEEAAAALAVSRQCAVRSS